MDEGKKMNISSISGPTPAPVKPKDADGDSDGTKVKSTEAEGPKSTTQPKDTVQVSSAAQKLVQESTETPAQTAAEAAKGDGQAKRLQAKEEASKAEAPPKEAVPKGSNVDVTA